MITKLIILTICDYLFVVNVFNVLLMYLMSKDLFCNCFYLCILLKIFLLSLVV